MGFVQKAFLSPAQVSVYLAGLSIDDDGSDANEIKDFRITCTNKFIEMGISQSQISTTWGAPSSTVGITLNLYTGEHEVFDEFDWDMG